MAGGGTIDKGSGGPPRALSRSRLLILLFSLVFIAAAWAVAVLQTRYERAEAINAAVRQNVNRAVALEQYVTRTLEAADMATLNVSERFLSGDGLDRFVGTRGKPRLITDAVSRDGMFAGLSVADASGYVVASTLPLPSGHPNVATQTPFSVHARGDSGRLFISAPRPSRRIGGTFIWLTRRINHADGSFAGVVSVNIAPERFTDFYKDADFSPADMISVIGLDGVTRARRTGAFSSFGEDLRGKLVMRRQYADPNGTYLGPSALDGKVRYFSHRRLKNYPLFVTSGVSRAAILQPVEKRALAYFLGAGLLTLMTIAFAGLLISYMSRRQKQADEIAEANRRLGEAQRIAQVGDWDHDLVTGAIKWSPQLCEMYERDPARLTLTFNEFDSYLDDEGRATIKAAVARALETGERQEYGFAATLPSGTQTYRQVVAVPTIGANGKAVRLHGTDQDVTSRKLVDALQQEIAHLSRVDAMNAMAATLAHELNQPLTAAANYLVGSRRLLPPIRPEKLNLVDEGMRSAERQVMLAAKIIRRVRDMVSTQPRLHETASLADIVAEAVSLVSVANSYPRVMLLKDLGLGANEVSGDSIQIQQVLMNLIKNACEATSEAEHPRVVIRSRRHGPAHVVVSVGDNGPGIPEASGDLFSPFATSKRGGLGLGLSISRTIVEAHGGKIWIEDTGGGGTTISFTLPVPAAVELELKIA